WPRVGNTSGCQFDNCFLVALANRCELISHSTIATCARSLLPGTSLAIISPRHFQTASLVADRLDPAAELILPLLYPPTQPPDVLSWRFQANNQSPTNPQGLQEDFQRGKANGLSGRLPAAAFVRRVEAGPSGPQHAGPPRPQRGAR